MSGNTGYVVTNVVVDGSSVGAVNSYTFYNVTSGHTISAFFGGSGTTGFNAWANRIMITFAGYSKPETLTNFPALVVLSTGIPGFSYSQFASTNGYDLRFSADGTNELNYEMEKWNHKRKLLCVGTGAAVNQSSYIWAYWNNPGAASGPATYTINGATWPSNAYAAVWHMGQNNSLDSTANGNNGTAVTTNGSVSTATGISGGGQTVAGGGWIQVPLSSSLELTTSVATVSGWVYFNTLPSRRQRRRAGDLPE